MKNAFDDVYVWVPEQNALLRIEEGSGDNLLKEDMEEGYVDYLNYDCLSSAEKADSPQDLLMQFTGGDAIDLCDIMTNEADGGMLLYKTILRESNNSLSDLIPDVLDQCFDTANLAYDIIDKEDLAA